MPDQVAIRYLKREPSVQLYAALMDCKTEPIVLDTSSSEHPACKESHEDDAPPVHVGSGAGAADSDASTESHPA